MAARAALSRNAGAAKLTHSAGLVHHNHSLDRRRRLLRPISVKQISRAASVLISARHSELHDFESHGTFT